MAKKKKALSKARAEIAEGVPAEGNRQDDEISAVFSYDPPEDIETPVQAVGRSEQERSTLPKPVALIAAVVLLVCILFLGYLFIDGLKKALPGKEATPFESGNGVDMLPDLPNETVNQLSPTECLASYGLDPALPVFTYLPTCPHCANMKPIMQELDKSGYPVSWVDRSQVSENVMVTKCLKGAVQGVVPQLICPKTLSQKTGELLESEALRFIETCRNA
ncbi:MAG: hypothetical protein ABIF01_04490 [Candidatus Micrarchaeota archaeon]